LPFSNFSSSNLVFDTGIYCGRVLALPTIFYSKTSAIKMYFNYKQTLKIVKTHTLMLKKAKNNNFDVLLHKSNTTIVSGMVENARNELDMAKNGLKNH